MLTKIIWYAPDDSSDKTYEDCTKKSVISKFDEKFADTDNFWN